MRTLIITLLVIIIFIPNFLFSSSSYWIHGLGDINTISQANAMGRGGTAIGIAEQTMINLVNPASLIFLNTTKIYIHYNQAIFNVKGGVTLSKNWLVGLDFSIVNYANGGFVADDINLKDINIKNYYVIATYFPKGSGWLLRTGGGMSRLVKIEEFKNDHDKDTERHTRGFGYTLGGGYSFWIGEQFNLSVYLDYSKQIYKDSSNEPDYSQFTALYLGFDWY